MQVPMAAHGMRIGLLGGSFNPAHDAHRHISLVALKRLGLDQVWWLVSPRNPLKRAKDLKSLDERIAEARAVADHPRIVVTGMEAARGSAYAVDTLKFLKRRLPEVNFVWLMGADNLAEFHRWRDWEGLFRLVPIAVLDRPGFRLKGRAGRAAQRFASAYIDETDSQGLPRLAPPAWTILTLPLSTLSSTRLRQGTEKKASKAQSKADSSKASKGAKRH